MERAKIVVYDISWDVDRDDEVEAASLPAATQAWIEGPSLDEYLDAEQLTDDGTEWVSDLLTDHFHYCVNDWRYLVLSREPVTCLRNGR